MPYNHLFSSPFFSPYLSIQFYQKVSCVKI